MNLRGNLYLREYLAEIDARAIELVEGLGGPVDEIAIDNYGLRASNAYATLETMAEQAETAEDVERLADIRAAMDEIEGLVDSRLGDVADHTMDFSGVLQGSQRGRIDSDIDVDKLRGWLEDRKLVAQRAMMDPQTSFESMQGLSWTSDYYDQMLKALDAGINPLAESSDQVVFIQVAKVDAFNAQFADEIAAAAAEGWVFVPPRAPDQDQLDLFLDLHDGLMSTISDPEYFRSAEETIADIPTQALNSPTDSGPGSPGLDAMRPLAEGVDEPDVTPVLGGDVPPPPDHRLADPSPGAGPGAPHPARHDPPPLDRTAPGAEGYDFQKAYGSLDRRNRFYRDEFNFRGNFFMREYLAEIDAKAFALFTDAGGPADEIIGDSFGYRTSSVYRTLEQMAAEADAGGEASRAAEVRAAMGEIEAMVDRTLPVVAARTDEFSGAAIGSQRAAIDRHIDTGKLRSWLADRMHDAMATEQAVAFDDPEARQLASREWGYYHELIQALDEGVNPLATSNEQIAVIRINKVEPHRAQFADEIAAGLPYPRIQAQDELELYARLQERLVETLSNPQFHRSAEEMGIDAFTWHVRERILGGGDLLGPDSLRSLAGGDIPPPLPAADFADSAGRAGEVRDRSFPRSALAASEETLERQAAGFVEGDAAIRGRAPDRRSGPPESSLATRRAPPDSAQAPHGRRAHGPMGPGAVHAARGLSGAG